MQDRYRQTRFSPSTPDLSPNRQRITSLFETTFRDLGEPPAIALAKANLFVNSWQGAIVVARAGGGLEHLRKVFCDLKEMVDLS
jgi:hypothetical protein